MSPLSAASRESRKSIRTIRPNPGQLLFSTAITTILVASLAANEAWAAGGAGGHGGNVPVSGGAGGTGFTGAAGGDGAGGPALSAGSGGGGGGAAGGGAGGSSGQTQNVGGAVGGTTPGQNGANGTDDQFPSGGGGGAGGANGVTVNAPTSITTNATGQNGGNGGNGGSSGSSVGAGGGGGGSGGYGAIVNGSGSVNIANTATITGGNGGNGGNAGNGPFGLPEGGSGGDGGVGLQSAGNQTITNAGTIAGGNGGLGGAGSVQGTAGAGGAGIVGSNLTVINSGSISGGLANGGGGGARANAITFSGGTNTLELRFGSSITGNVVAFSTADTFRLGGATDGSFNVGTIGAAAQYQGFGVFEKTGASTWTLSGTTTATTPWSINAGTLAITDDASLGNVGGALTFNGGTLRVSTAGGPTVAIARNITLAAGGGTVETAIDTILSGNITGAGSLTKTGNSILSLTGTNTYTGATNVTAGQLQSDAANAFSAASAFTVSSGASIELRGSQQSIGSLAGAGAVTNNNVAAAVLTTGLDNTSTTFSGVMSDAGVGLLSLVKAGSGTLRLTGTNTYGGTTTVNGGLLQVDGSIANSSLTTVSNAGSVLLGTGQVGAAQINQYAILAPGISPSTSMTLASVAFQSGSLYLIQLNPTTSSFANVTGNAGLNSGAQVVASFANGTYVVKQYTIMTAGSITGTFSPTVSNSNLPSGFRTTLSYDPTHVYLNLALSFAPPSGSLNGNQQAVGNAIINYFNTNGSIPIAFGGLTPAGLTQLSGEVGSAPQQTTFNAMTQFLGLMTDPFIGGRGDPVATGGATNAFADDSMAYAGNAKRPAAARDAFAAYTKAPAAASFAQRWSIWAAGFGGSQQTDGNVAVGSNTTTSSVYGTAVGADYRLSRDTLLGFALAGGGANFSVANNLGGGRSDLFQAGAFFRHTAGPAYLAGSLAYGWQDIVTDRTVTVAGLDRLRAQFNANAYSGRLEGGTRFVYQGVGWTPYAAGQFVTFALPTYAEQAIVGSNQFALAYNARNVTDSRSELGLRTDKAFAQDDGIVTLRGRLAWAHDFNPNRTIGATFQTLPGASFVVSGAAMASDAALVTASAEKKWLNGWSAAATFEGEFSNVTRSYAGKGAVRYAW